MAAVRSNSPGPTTRSTSAICCSTTSSIRLRRARLNILSHILSKIPYEDPKHSKVELPKRQHRGDYKDPDYPFRMIPEVF